MPFEWNHPDVPKAVTRTFAQKAADSLRQEVKQRATMLRNLGFTQAQAEARCRQNLEWDYEVGAGACPISKEVGQLVGDVFRR